MRFWKSWIVTQKDLSVIRRNNCVFYSLIGLPLTLGVLSADRLRFRPKRRVQLSLTHDQFVVASNELINNPRFT